MGLYRGPRILPSTSIAGRQHPSDTAEGRPRARYPARLGRATPGVSSGNSARNTRDGLCSPRFPRTSDRIAPDLALVPIREGRENGTVTNVEPGEETA